MSQDDKVGLENLIREGEECAITDCEEQFEYAHSLIQRLTAALKAPASADRPQLGQKLKRLREAWEAMVSALYPFTHKAEWNTVMVELDGAINDFLNAAPQAESDLATAYVPKSDSAAEVSEKPAVAAPLSSARSPEPQSTYVPLTRAQIEDWREVLAKKYDALSAAASSPDLALRLALAHTDVDTLCDMAINSLLYAQEIDRLRSAPSATSQHKDEARLLWLDTLLRHCPHAELTYNDDEDDGPVGFRLVVESCTRLDLQAPTLDALIDLGIRTSPDEDGDVVARSDGASPK